MTSPGSMIFAALARCLDRNLLESVVAPTVADLQYEVQTAGSPWRQRLTRARGYVTIARLLLWHGLIWRSPMRTLLAIVVLGLAGAACLVEMFSVTTSGPVQILPLFLMTIVAPIVLRFVVGVNTRRGMFLTCMGVGTVMCVVFHGWFALVLNPGHAPWYAYVRGLVFLLACVAAASAIIAIVTASPDTAGVWNVRGKFVDVLASTATFAVCYSLIGAVRRPPSGVFGVLDIVSSGVFLAFFFVVVLVVAYLPILVASRRLLHQHSRAPLAVLGAVLFPIPMLVFPFLGGRLEDVARVLLNDPVVLASLALPYVVAGAMLGWWLSAPRQDVRHGI